MAVRPSTITISVTMITIHVIFIVVAISKPGAVATCAVGEVGPLASAVFVSMAVASLWILAAPGGVIL